PLQLSVEVSSDFLTLLLKFSYTFPSHVLRVRSEIVNTIQLFLVCVKGNLNLLFVAVIKTRPCFLQGLRSLLQVNSPLVLSCTISIILSFKSCFQEVGFVFFVCSANLLKLLGSQLTCLTKPTGKATSFGSQHVCTKKEKRVCG